MSCDVGTPPQNVWNMYRPSFKGEESSLKTIRSSNISASSQLLNLSPLVTIGFQSWWKICWLISERLKPRLIFKRDIFFGAIIVTCSWLSWLMIQANSTDTILPKGWWLKSNMPFHIIPPFPPFSLSEFTSLDSWSYLNTQISACARAVMRI